MPLALLASLGALHVAMPQRDVRLPALLLAPVLAWACAKLLGRLDSHVELRGTTLLSWRIAPWMPLVGRRRLESARDVVYGCGLDACGIVGHSLQWPHEIDLGVTYDEQAARWVVRRLRAALVRARTRGSAPAV